MTHPRRILLAVTGLSPQILTETLYALGVAPDGATAPFVPTEVHLLTTADGAHRARNALLHPDGGEFHKLLADYPQLGRPVFDETHIHLIRGADAQPLPDIRTPEENACAADAITALMAELTRDTEAALHVSIAGGRKTMGFYLGYAFSLFARPQDELSHVLVSAPFESHPEFFFPPATPRRLATRDGQHIDTADACITLARIPVVRLRHGQPQALLDGHASFGDTVAAIQQSLEPPRLEIYWESGEKKPTVQCGNQRITLAPKELAWLIWWAERAKNNETTHAPRAKGDSSNLSAERFLQIYGHLDNPVGMPFAPSSDRQVVAEKTETFQSMKTTLASGIYKSFFEQGISKLENALKEQLGHYQAKRYMIQRKKGEKHGQTIYSLGIDPEAICIDLE